jgi:hypothetical protein
VVAPPAGQGRTAVGPVTDGGGDEAVRLGRVRLLAGVVTGGRHGGGEPPAGEVVGGGGGGRTKVSEEEDDIKWASLGRAFGCVLIFRKEDRSPPPSLGLSGSAIQVNLCCNAIVRTNANQSIYSPHHIKSAILTFEKKSHKECNFIRPNYLPKWSDLISLAKLTPFGKQMRVLESFHSSTNLSKKQKLHSFTGWKEY